VTSALWLLLGLQLKSYLRFFARSLRTVKGAALAFVGLAVVASWVLMLGFSPSSDPLDPAKLRLNGPPILLAYCIIQVLLSASETSIYFTPAEVQFLFTGPFTRRQILLYKITLLTLLTLPVPLLFTILFRQHAGGWITGMLGMTLGILFLNLFTIATNLLVDLLGAALYSRARKIAFAALLVGIGLFVAFSGGMSDLGAVGNQATSLAQSPIVQTICWPLSWFFELFLAHLTTDFVGFLVALGMALLVDLAMLMVVFALDKNFLEVAAGNSARVYARIQQMRRGQTALAIGGSAGFSLPDFPFWGGVGPTFWRQTTQALRGMGRLIFTLIIVGVVATLPLSRGGGGAGGPEPTPFGLLGASAGILVWVTIFLTMIVPFDFRGDVDRLALLKSLPIPTWALVIGQLLTPTVVTTLFHWLVLLGLSIMAWSQGMPLPLGPVLAMAVLFPTFNFLMFGVENLLFLIFPTRLTQNTPGDFQSVGRSVLLTLSKLTIVFVVVGLAAGAAVWVYYTLGQNMYLSLGVAWLVLTVAGLSLVPPMMVAFHHFDVGRDTPP
jgi:hypothetical protein